MLEHSKLFSRLADSELEILRRCAREQKFSAGQEVFKEGDSGDGIYVVKEGLVDIAVELAPGARRVFSQIGAGDFFGEMAVIESKARSATAVASRDTTVDFIPRDDLLAMLERSPGLAIELLREVSGRLRDFNRRYVQEILQTERLAIIGRFARAIVHDLKNPLSVIGLTADMAALENASLDIRRNSQHRIRTQIDRINDLVSEILEFTHGPQEQLILTLMDYGQFASQVVEEIQSEIDIRGVKVEFAGPLPAERLRINPKRLRRVFHNLMHNATDFMPGGGQITIRFQTGENEIVTEIEDTGPGIAPQIADQLFQAFATFGKAHGTGLGLSICKKIVEDHAGRIWARNAPGRGAIFSFALPTHDSL